MRACCWVDQQGGANYLLITNCRLRETGPISLRNWTDSIFWGNQSPPKLARKREMGRARAVAALAPRPACVPPSTKMANNQPKKEEQRADVKAYNLDAEYGYGDVALEAARQQSRWILRRKERETIERPDETSDAMGKHEEPPSVLAWNCSKKQKLMSGNGDEDDRVVDGDADSDGNEEVKKGTVETSQGMKGLRDEESNRDIGRNSIQEATHQMDIERVVLFAGMSAMQKRLYRDVLMRNMDLLRGSSRLGDHLLDIALELRKCTEHPYLLPGVEDRSLNPPGEHLIQNCR